MRDGLVRDIRHALRGLGRTPLFTVTVVLTFAQIEDLLGFELPELARRGREWWTTTDTSSMQCRAWTNAHRTAVPNLTAQTVTFERA